MTTVSKDIPEITQETAAWCFAAAALSFPNG